MVYIIKGFSVPFILRLIKVKELGRKVFKLVRLPNAAILLTTGASGKPADGLYDRPPIPY